MASVIEQLLNTTGPVASPQINVPEVADIEQLNWQRRHSGAAGVARDILGNIGDILLSRLRLGTPYNTSKRNHELMYASQGYDSTDPQQSADAINRVKAIDFNAGTQLEDEAFKRQYRQSMLESTLENRQFRQDMKQQLVRDGYLKGSANFFNKIADLPEEKRAEAYAQGRKLWDQSSVVRNDPELRQQLEDFFPQDYNPDTFLPSIARYTDVNKQWAASLNKDRAETAKDQGQQKIDETARYHDIQHNDRMTSVEHADARSTARIAASDRRDATKPPKARKPTADDIKKLRQNPGARDYFDGEFGLGASKKILGN